MGAVSIIFEYMRRGRMPKTADKLVMPQGCYKEIVGLNPLQSRCSNPKTCPNPDKCDLSKATITRNGKVVS